MKFCAKCGKKGETKEGLCNSCYSKLHPASGSSKEIKIKVCEGCNKAFHRNRLSRYTNEEEMIKGIVKEKIKGQIEVTPIITRDKVEAEIETAAGEKYIIPIKIENTECDRCKKEATKYFEGTLQLRNIPEDVVNYAINELDKKQKDGVFVNNIENVKNGVDIMITSQKFLQALGTKLKKRFGGSVKLTRKLFTRNKQTSKHVYRVTLLYKQD